MNTLVIVLIAAVILFGAYMVYGRWLANKWGIDPKAETPAVKYNDGKDYVPNLPIYFSMIIPIDLPSFLTEAYKAPKYITAPKNTPPIRIQSNTGNHPNAAA